MSTVNINIKHLIKKIVVRNDSDLKDIQARITEAVTRAVALGAALGADENKDKDVIDTLSQAMQVNVGQ